MIESPAYLLLQAADRFQHPTRGRNELWQTDFTDLPVVGWGGYSLSTVLDDYSSKILAWRPWYMSSGVTFPIASWTRSWG